MHCSFKSLLIYIYVSQGSCILNFYAASICFAAFLSKIWVVSLHYVCSFVKLYIELVYPMIDYCSVCSSGLRLSVLKSHFDLACITVSKQLLSKSEKRFVHTHWVQEGLGLSEVLCVRTVLFVGKCGVRFRRFKKGSRALATRAKTHCLD